MNDPSVIPSSYEHWRYCIEVKGGIALTEAFIHRRLAELEDESHPDTRQFEKLYGSLHRQQVISWFRRASKEVPKP